MKIVSIESFYNYHGGELDCFYSTYQGYKIKTDEKEFIIAIDSFESCCESFGHISSEEDFSKFIGANVNSFRCVNDADYTDCELTKTNAGNCVDVYDCAFIDFQTSVGVLQFAVYNAHNGYYGHDIKLIERDIKMPDITMCPGERGP